MKFETMWSYKHKAPAPLSQEPCALKDDTPFKTLTERALEAKAMGEAYIAKLRSRFMIPKTDNDVYDNVDDMDSVLTEFDACEDMGDAQRAYNNYMERQRLYQAQLRFAREHQAQEQAKSTPPAFTNGGNQA